MTDHSFPTADQLDQLRAGLLDDDPVLTRNIQAAVARNPGTAHGGWERVRHELDRRLERFPTLRNELRLRRRAALIGKRRLGQRAPIFATAAIAALAMVVGVALLAERSDAPTPGAALPVLQETVRFADESQHAIADERLDLAHNLDFYVWLANQRQASTGEDGR
jgi:hypothetical protein